MRKAYLQTDLGWVDTATVRRVTAECADEPQLLGFTRAGLPIWEIRGGQDRSITVALRAVVGQYQTALRSAGAQTSAFGSQIARTGAQNKAAFTGMGIAAAAGGALMLRGLSRAGDMAVEFQGKLLRLRTQIGLSEAEMNQMGAAALGLRGTGQGALELADAAFFVASAGLRGAEALDVLESSAKASAIGLGETAVIADTVTSAMNAYGSDVLSAAEATDVLVATVREGKAEAPALASALGRVLPIASALDVKFNEVGAAVAAMTRTGTDASTATIQLRQMLVSLIKPATQTEEALADMGLSSARLRDTIKRDGLWAALMDLRGEIGNNDEALAQIFPNVRALAGFLDLTGSNAEDNAKVFASLADSLGLADEGFETWATSAEAAEARFSASMEAAQITVGERVEPAMTKLRNLGTSAVEGFMAMPEPAQTAAVAVGGLAGSIGLVGGAGLLVIPRLESITTSLSLMRGAAAAGLRGMRSLALFMSTPWGMAFLAAAATLGLFIKGMRDADDRARALLETLDQNAGKAGGFTRELIRSRVEGGAVADALRDIGISSATFTSAVLGNEEALGRVRGALEEARGEGESWVGVLKIWENNIDGVDESVATVEHALRGLTNEVTDAEAEWEDYSNKLERNEGVSRPLAGQQILVADALRLVEQAASDTSVELDEADKILLAVAESGGAAGDAFAEVLAGGLADVADQMRDNIPLWGEYEGAAEIAVDEVIASLRRFVGDMGLWSKTVASLSGEASEATISALMAMPPAQQAALGHLAKNAPGEFAELIAEYDKAFTEIDEIASDTLTGVLPGLAGDGIEQMAATIEANAQTLINAGQSSTEALRLAMGITLAKLPPDVAAALEPVIAEMIELEDEAGERGTGAGIGLADGLTAGTEEARREINDLIKRMLGIPNVTRRVDILVKESVDYSEGRFYDRIGHQGGLVSALPSMHAGGLAGNELIARLRTDEFVMNPEATRRFQPALEQMNAFPQAIAGSIGSGRTDGLLGELIGAVKASPRERSVSLTVNTTGRAGDDLRLSYNLIRAIEA